MPEDFRLSERISPLLRRIGIGGGGQTEEEPVLITPDTIRNPGMAADGATNTEATTNVPFARSNIAIGGELGRAIDRVKQLLTSGFLNPVTKKNAGTALQNLALLSQADRAQAVEVLGADLLTTMESKLGTDHRRQFADALAEIRTARNAAFNPPSKDEFLALATKVLHGAFEHSFVREGQARGLIDALRRFDPATQDAIFDELGPGKLQWLASGLSKIDREIYQPTVDAMKNAHFGAVGRADAVRGLSPQEVTQRYLEILAAVERKDDDPLRMRLDPEKHGKVTYYFVPGLATEHQPGYFGPNIERLEKRGLKVVMSKLDTDADMATNRATIKGEMRELSGGVEGSLFPISHSKGGPDLRSAMIDPEIDKLCYFWDAIQSACGTPVSNTLMEGAGAIIERVFKDVFGAPNGNALRDLDYKTQKALWLNSRPIETPILSFATRTGDARGPLVEIANIMKRRYGIDSDGLVPFGEQLIGGKNAFSVIMDGFDHAAPVYRPMPGNRPKHDPADLQEARILLAFELKERMG